MFCSIFPTHENNRLLHPRPALTSPPASLSTWCWWCSRWSRPRTCSLSPSWTSSSSSSHHHHHIIMVITSPDLHSTTSSSTSCGCCTVSHSDSYSVEQTCRYHRYHTLLMLSRSGVSKLDRSRLPSDVSYSSIIFFHSSSQYEEMESIYKDHVRLS